MDALFLAIVLVTVSPLYALCIYILCQIVKPNNMSKGEEENGN